MIDWSYSLEIVNLAIAAAGCWGESGTKGRKYRVKRNERPCRNSICLKCYEHIGLNKYKCIYAARYVFNLIHIYRRISSRESLGELESRCWPYSSAPDSSTLHIISRIVHMQAHDVPADCQPEADVKVKRCLISGLTNEITTFDHSWLTRLS